MGFEPRKLFVSLCLCGSLCISLRGPLLAAAADPVPEDVKNSPAIQQHYQDALQAYARGDYRLAIIKWTAILKEEPDQRTASDMILDARRKIAFLTKKRRRHAFEFISSGQYLKSFLELQALLDQDPGDPQLEALQRRLDNVIKLSPILLPQTKAARAAVRGLAGFLVIPPDLKSAHNGLRYACELAPGEVLYKKLLGLLLADYPTLTTEDGVTPGMTLMEYKHFVALHQIYDAKYPLAVGTLNEILALEPGDLLALKRLGSAYYSFGRVDEARAAWVSALKIAPRDKTLQRFLAKTKEKRVSGLKLPKFLDD